MPDETTRTHPTRRIGPRARPGQPRGFAGAETSFVRRVLIVLLVAAIGHVLEVFEGVRAGGLEFVEQRRPVDVREPSLGGTVLVAVVLGEFLQPDAVEEVRDPVAEPAVVGRGVVGTVSVSAVAVGTVAVGRRGHGRAFEPRRDKCRFLPAGPRTGAVRNRRGRRWSHRTGTPRPVDVRSPSGSITNVSTGESRGSGTLTIARDERAV